MTATLPLTPMKKKVERDVRSVKIARDFLRPRRDSIVYAPIYRGRNSVSVKLSTKKVGRGLIVELDLPTIQDILRQST